MITFGKDENLQIASGIILDKKKPSLCIQRGNTLTKLATFRDEEAEQEFWEALKEILGLEKARNN